MEEQVYICAECGHLHFLGRNLGYCKCPIEGCDCQGQEWAKELQPNPIGDLDELWHRIYDGCQNMDNAQLVFILTRRRDRLSRMQELDMPGAVTDYERTMITATEQAARERGLL